MKGRIAHTAAVATAAVALLLTGCGSDEGGPDDAIKGAGSADDPKDTSDSAGPDAPEFDLPNDVRVEISDDETGDEAKDEILEQHGYALMAQQESYAATEPTENFKRFWDGAAAVQFETSFKGYREDGETITGLDRFYYREVTWMKGDRAMVAFCEDQSEAYDKNVETGEVIKDEHTVDDYIDVRTTMQKGADGWKVVEVQGQRGSQECRDKA